VFLGNGKYFVSSDVGGGKMQWYAFNKEPADGTGERRLGKCRQGCPAFATSSFLKP
jgi:zeaxanthin epoxidase